MPRNGARIPFAAVALLVVALVAEANAIDVQYEELQKHAAKSDCWIALDGKVILVLTV
jgi:cytochrome b involved in lipid metabolism